MVQKGKKLKRGEVIDFLYVNAAHTNPFRRVISASLLNDLHYYDKERYLEMVLDVAETILCVFGFSRKQLGISLNQKAFLRRFTKKESKKSFPSFNLWLMYCLK